MAKRTLYGTVIVTYRCNARCNMCDQTLPIPASKQLPGPACLYQFRRSTSRGDYVLYFGRFSEEKGTRTLLEACRALQEIPFVFAGTGLYSLHYFSTIFRHCVKIYIFTVAAVLLTQRLVHQTGYTGHRAGTV